MSFLLYHFQRLIYLPYNLFFSPDGGVGSVWNESGRGRALVLGLPAIVFALLGVLFLSIAEFGVVGTLEDRYRNEAEDSANVKNELVIELRQDARMAQATQRSEAGDLDPRKLASQFIAKDDPRREELKDLQSREEIYLEKLIDLNPSNADYRFQLSMLSFEKGDVNRGLALLKMIAPLGEPGHIKSHLWLANYFMRSKAATREDALANLDLAIAHANQCLKRENENLTAKQLKARLLFAKRDYNAAYVIFRELFEQDTRYFKPLIEINKRRGKVSENGEVLDQAIIRLTQQLGDPELGERDKARLWADLTNCYRSKGDFIKIESLLLEQLEAATSADSVGSRLWLERLLSTIYLTWIGDTSAQTADALRNRLELLKKAYKYDPTNPVVLREFVRIGFSDDPVASEAAKQMYDPYNHPDAPGLVLNELGAQALARTEYDLAIQYFGMAKDKSPKNPEILNNMAYAFLVGEKPNPARALKLIEDALKYLPNTDDARKYLSFFRDTRARALMQLERYPQAIKEFEFARMDRPDNVGIIEALIKCYKAMELDPGPYERQLAEVLAKQESNQ